MTTLPDTLEALAADVKRSKSEMQLARARFYAGAGSYEEMAEAAKTFCQAFYVYQAAKVGKSKARLPRWQSVLRG